MTKIQITFMIRGLIVGGMAALATHWLPSRWFLVGILVYYSYMLAGDIVSGLKS